MIPIGSKVNTTIQGILILRAKIQIRATTRRQDLEVMEPLKGELIALHLSKDIAIKVFTEADTETPWR